MEWLLVFMLILIGAVLVLMEFLIFPGVNIAGLLGFICIIAGIYFGYSFYGAFTGHFILLGTAIFGAGLTWYVLRSDTWKKLSLSARIDSVVEGIDKSIHEGDEWETLGQLAPMGNVRVGDCIAEAESQSGFISAHQQIEVVKVFKNKIIVKLKTE